MRQADAIKSVDGEIKKQPLNKCLWHGMHMHSLEHEQCQKIIHSTCFVKDKYTAQGLLDKFKARLAAGGGRRPQRPCDLRRCVCTDRSD